MTLFLALSCLQGRPRSSAAAELMSLDVDGLQLTPGNPPDLAFEGELRAAGTPFRTHHGYIETCLRGPVWDGVRCVSSSDSVHPPRLDKGNESRAQEAEWRRAETPGCAIELMYPGYMLGTGEGAEWAMEAKLPLVVDVSHIHIQRSQGVMEERTWRKLQDYEHILEVHVSANEGQHDSHRPLGAGSFGLDWARAKMRSGTLCVLECYMHRLEMDARQRQVALLRGQAS
ncbi:MAG: hypothetical protein AB8H86_16925 [Polyangiales bacterium]